MASSEVANLHDTIMPEIYAITAEHQRRAHDREEMPLNYCETTDLEIAVSLAVHTAHLTACFAADDMRADQKHAVAIALATDAVEIARRVRS